MSINLDLVRQKLEGFKSQNKRTNYLWKPEEGKQSIRVVPYRFQKEYPFIELHFHYNIPGKSYLSPMSFGQPDPFVEFAKEVLEQGGSENYAKYKKLMPTRRTYAPVVVRGKEEEGVKFWGFGKTIYKQLLTWLAEPEIGDFTSPDDDFGCDIRVTYTPKEKSTTDFPQTDIMLARNTSKITTDKELLKKIYESQVEITEVFPLPTYDELVEALEKYLNPETEEASDTTDAEDDAPQAKGKSVTANKAKKTIADLESEWDDVFNDD